MRGARRELALAAAFAVAFGCATGRADLERLPRTIEERIADAEQRLTAGQREEAFRRLRALSGELEEGLRSALRRADLHLWLGTTRHLQEDEGAALQHLAAAAADARVAALASYDAGQIQQLRSEHGAALDWFLRAERADPGDWRTAAKCSAGAQTDGWEPPLLISIMHPLSMPQPS